MKILLSLFVWGMMLASAVGADAPRLLFLLADGFNRGEFYQSYLPLKALGYDIDVASMEAGTVYLRSDGTVDTQGRDVQANLALREVQPDAYLGLILPGGYSPGNLEKHPESLEICRAFMQQEQLVAAVCHGPRLLMRAKLLDGRRMTCLHTVALELADDWKDRHYGTYFDREVVVDGNLITSRYPRDMPVFTRTVAAALSARGGLPLPPSPVKILLLSATAQSRHERWALVDAPGIFGLQVVLVSNLDELKAQLEPENPLADIDLVMAEDTDAVAGLLAAPAFQQAAERFKRPLHILPSVEQYDELLQPLVAGVFALAPDVEAPAPEAAGAEPEDLGPLTDLLATVMRESRPVVVALRNGFDDDVLIRTLADFKKANVPVTLVANAPGHITGLNGHELVVPDGQTYQAIPMMPEAVILAPGGIFPEKAEAVRQAQQPEWIEEQAQKDDIRKAWLMQQWQSGATLITVGFDSLRLAKDPMFHGHAFASSDQTVWSFPRNTGGAYTEAPVAATAERLVSVKSAEQWSAALDRLLEKAH